MTFHKIKIFLKRIYLFLNDSTIQSRFFFEGEYGRWKNFDRKGSAKDYGGRGESGENKSVYYLVPGVSISGGIAVIFKHANQLRDRGFEVKILSLNNKNDDVWFRDQKVKIVPFREVKKILRSGEIDILIATGYSTAFTVDMANARRKIYFVQADERQFIDEPKTIEIIGETYGIDCEYMTEALWIQKWLKEEFGHDASYVPNGIDLNIFRKTEPIEPKNRKPRILIEGAINLSRKGMDDAYNAVKDLECELWIISNNGRPREGWRYARFFENVPFYKMNEVYSSCDILLKMSRAEGFFGPPLEAMACGCAVVTGKVSGYDEYIVDDKNALVVEQRDVAGAKKAVERLMGDIELRNKLIANGYATAKEWSWDRSIDLLEKVINKNPA